MSEMLKVVRDHLMELETHEFAAQINVFSNLEDVERAIRCQHPVNVLKESCLKSTSTLEMVIENVRILCNRQVDLRFESPWDIALLSQLVVLKDTDYHSAYLAACMIQKTPQTWWAEKAARQTILYYHPIEHSVANLQEKQWESIINTENWLNPGRQPSTMDKADSAFFVIELHSASRNWPIKMFKLLSYNTDIDNLFQKSSLPHQQYSQNWFSWSEKTKTLTSPNEVIYK